MDAIFSTGRGRRVLVMVTLALALLAGLFPAPTPSYALSSGVVISQVYGGGGNTGATLRNDFVELFNRGTTTVDLTGWSVQYASSAGTSWAQTNLSGSVAPGQYYLIQQAQGAGNQATLPTPDATGTIAMSATAGKLALVNSTTALAGSCPSAAAGVIDFVGYGAAANCSETAPTPTLSNSTAALRASNGCTETDNNSADFASGTPAPRNTASPLNPCGGASTPSVSISTNDASASEAGSDPGVFAITRSGDTAAPLTVNYSLGGTASSGDYSPTLTGTVEISAGASLVIIGITPVDDAAAEGAETLTLSVSAGTGYNIGTPASATVTIADNDAVVPVCEQPATPISAIQGSGSSAALTGPATVQGIVTGIFPGLSAITLQEELADQDGNPASSEGIAVFLAGNFATLTSGLAVGDVARVSGSVEERSTSSGASLQTQIVAPSGGALSVTDCGPAAETVAPTDVTFPLSSASALERYESMLVRFPQELFIGEYFNYDRFGELVIGYAEDVPELADQERFFTPTSVVEPGAPAAALAAQYALRRITLDDGSSASAPSQLRHPNGAPFSQSNRFRGGDKLENTMGVIEETFGVYRIQPTAPALYTAANPRESSPADVGGRLTVASYNVLNYFLSIDTTSSSSSGSCGPSGLQDCRGADSASEFGRQRAKLLEALRTIDADVFGLIELENTPGVDPLANLVAGLGPDFAAINTGVIGTDAIRVGLIYKPGSVTPLGGFQILDSTDDPRFLDTKNRPALAQTFEENSSGARFTVVVNHFKSKGSDCNDVGDPDTGDGQGNCNQTRVKAAQALVDWLASDPTGSNDPDFLIVGDLNSYANEDPIDAIETGADNAAGTSDDFVNLIADRLGTFAYSYVFDGQAGYLDHALANLALEAQVTGVTDWHLNADEPDIFDYNDAVADLGESSTERRGVDLTDTGSPFRTADHDPVIVGLSLTQPNTAPLAGDDSATTGYKAPVTIPVLANDSDPDGDTLSVTSVSAPASGSAVINSDGTITYTPSAEQATGSLLTDSFSYTVSDGAGGTATATVTVQIARLRLTSLCSDFPNQTRSWRVFNPASQPLAFSYEVFGTSQTGTLTAAPGELVFSTSTVSGPNTTIVRVNGVQQDVKASGGQQCNYACYGTGVQEVVSYTPGVRKDGKPILTARQNATKALGAPQKNDTENFVSLGFPRADGTRGSLVLRFNNVIVDGTGDDFQVWETSFGDAKRAWSSYPEAVEVYVSQDGVTYIKLGVTTAKDQRFDLAGKLPWAKFLKLVDVSDPRRFGSTDDGFDVDGIEVLSACVPAP